jgi:exodeoxyribonuclease VII large subunit
MRERQRGLAQRLERARPALTARPGETLRQAATRLVAATRGEARRARERARFLGLLEGRLRRAFAEAQRRRAERLAKAKQVFDAVNYKKVLARGFALVRDASHAPLRRAADVEPGQALRVEFADGEIGATADGSAAPPAKRPRKRARREEQGSLF